jgi:hypothetical protein
VTFLLRLVVGIAVSCAVLMALAALLGGRVGFVELMLLLIPSALAGIWASRRIKVSWRSRDSYVGRGRAG